MASLLRIHQREYAAWFVQYSIKTFVIFGILLGSFQFVQAQQCSITINKVTVSGCYLLSGQSKATVSIEVGWSGAPANDSIEVTLGTEKRYIRPGTFAVKYPATTVMGNQTIVTPQVIAFEVDATGGSLPITAQFTTQTSCSATSTAQLPAACPALVCSGNQAGGTVFNDYDADGVKDAGEINGVAGVTVIAYNCAGGIAAQTTTDASGKYVLSVSASDYPIRVEFVNLPSYAGQGTMHGGDSRTTVQFVTAPDCTIDLGVLDKNDFCQTTPQVVVPCYVYGKPDVGSLSGQLDALVAFDYGTTGPKDMSKMELLAKAEEVGTLWGVAYNRHKHKVYTSATLKRHAGLGPLGLGGIYVADMATNTAAPYVDVSQPPLNINVGATNAGDPWFGMTNTTRGLNPDPAQPSADSLAFELIGKVGIGDLEMSEDGKSLYFINLFDKKLYQIDISGASPSLVGSWIIPDPGCIGGTLRPFATKVYKGKVYVGSVCDASTSIKSNLRGFVNAFDGTNFTQVFDFPLTYPKGAVLINNTPAVVDRVGWYPWTDSFNTVNSNTTNGTFIRVLYPQPMLTDIEFDIDGSMVLALGDRTGLQSGFNNYRPSGTGVYTGLAGGDVLRAAFTNGTFILENNGKVPGLSGSGVNNNQGAGFGEFYNDDFLGGNGALTHAEIAFGALALKPGSGQVITTAMDPIDQNQTGTNFSGGIRYWSNTTGLTPSGAAMGFVLYNTNNDVGTFGKSTGLGDMEILCELPMYLEIGNYVWNDANKNGVQDPCEKALKDINVTLYKGTTKIATTKTGTNGEYYFSSASKLVNGTWTGTGADTILLATTAYKLVFGEGQLVGGKLTVAGLGQFDVTLKDATASNGNDQNDSDAEVISGAFCINLTTGESGSVNHTFDAGFYCTNPPIGVNSIAVTTPKCVFTTPQNNGKISLSSAIAPYDKYRTKTGTGAWSGDTTYATATAIGSTFPKDLVTGISNAGATYTIRFYNGECCYKDTTIIIAPVACCTKPVASASPQKQTICVGGTAAAFTATPSTGVEYKWYGPLTSTSGSLGTAISGATNATFTPSGASLSTAGTKYYAVVVNTTGDVACADTAFVELDVSKITVPAVTALCHANGTPEDATDDYMTFSIHVGTEPMSTNKFTVTATQGGNPLAVTLSNGGAATSINCGLNTPLRTASGSAGKGNVTLTITDNVTGCSTTLVVTDPGTCAVTCVQGTPSTVVYQYATQMDVTELDALPIMIPKFDEQGGTRVLQSVKLEYTVGGKTAFVFENSAAQSQSFNAKASSEAALNLNGTDIATNTIEMVIPQTSLPGGILVAATGSWPGDSIPSPVPTPTTLGRMESWVRDYLTVFKDPRTDARWVTNATGDATDDDDMYLNPMISDSVSGTFTYTTALGLAPFIGTGNVPLHVSTLSGLSLTGGGGNLRYLQRTRAYASAKVTYTYICILCTKPVAFVTPQRQTICAGGAVTAFTATPSTGVDYKWYGPLADTTSSLGTAVSGATSGTFTPSGAALTTAGTKYYAVVVNTTGDVTCADTAYVQLVVNSKPVIADGSGTICAGESVDLTSNITNYNSYQGQLWTIGTASGTAVTTPSSVKPTGTTTYVLVAQNAAGCKDTANVVVTVNPKPSAGKDTTLVCANGSVPSSVQLVAAPTGGTWVALSGNPTGATVNSAGLVSITNTTAQGKSFDFIYTLNDCQDTVKVIVPVCVQPKGSIGDYVWKDQNNNGVQDSGEPAVAGVIVQLLNSTTSAVLATDTTDVNGLYLFSNLNSGTYQVKIVVTSLPAGCVISSQQNLGGDDTKDSDFNPTTGLSQVVTIDALGTGIAKDNPTVDAGLYSPKGSIGDYVWKDQNNNGVQDSGEPAVAGVIVQLLNSTTSAVLATDTTDVNGLYLFSNLNSGTYQVKIVTTSLPAGCVISSQQNLGGDDTKDSDFNPTTGLSQVVTIDALGTGIAKDNPTVDAGLYSPKGSIGDYVWKDQNNNGVQDSGEPAVAGVIVQLLNSTTSAVLATDTTDANGLYLFSNLNSGTYQVKIVTTSLPAGCVISSQQNLGGDDTKDSDFNPTTGLSQVVTIDALGTGIAKDNPTVDAGLYSPKGSIGDYVWKDQNNNGVQDSGEPAVAGVIVQLLNSTTSAVLATDTTDANGLYLFSNLNSGTYQVKIVTTSLPAGCVISSQQNLGGDDTKDSDFNPTTGLSQVVTIDALGTGIAKDNPTVDAGLYSPKGSIGDYVWKDQNNNGVQDSGEPAVAGVIVQLLNSTTSAVLATDTTNAQGLYLFSNLNSGTYQVKIVTTSLPAGCVISSQQNLGGDDTKDSDFNPTTGLSQVVTIDALGTGIAKDNPTVDAGLVVPCVESSVTMTGAPVCSADVQTYSISFTITNKLGIVKVNKGTLSGNNPYTVSGIPSGQSVIITDSLSAICKSDTTITGVNCNCNPALPQLLTPSLTACIGDTFPTLKATVVGLATVEWFSQQTGGTVLATGLNYKPSGTVTTNTVFYAQARSTDPTCPTAVSTSRVPATINAQSCIDTIDLALKKSINTKIARVGDVLTYTIKVWNEWNKNATGVEVTDSIATTVQFVSGSFVASRGSATISGNVIKWNIGNIAANGDTVTLRYQVRATQAGVHLNTAEISKTNEKDRDSTPGNGKGGEDDIDQQCFTVPFELCPTQKLEVSVPASLTNVQWYKNGGTTAVATGNVVLFSEIGTYTFTATNQTCPANGCCPVIIEAGTNCCPVDICVPFTVKKKRK